MKYINRTIQEYNSKVTFVMNGQLNEYIIKGEVGKKKAKSEIEKVFSSTVIIVSIEKELESEKLYRMPEETFISMAEIVETK